MPPTTACTSCGPCLASHIGYYGTSTVDAVLKRVAHNPGQLVVCPLGDFAGLVLASCARLNLKYVGVADAADNMQHYKCLAAEQGNDRMPITWPF